jgi:hypothetical protein
LITWLKGGTLSLSEKNLKIKANNDIYHILIKNVGVN